MAKKSVKAASKKAPAKKGGTTARGFLGKLAKRVGGVLKKPARVVGRLARKKSASKPARKK